MTYIGTSEMVVFAREPGSGTIDLFDGDAIVSSHEVELVAGANHVPVEMKFDRAGVRRLSARIRGDDSAAGEKTVSPGGV